MRTAVAPAGQRHVVFFEELVPREAHPVPGLVPVQPVAVEHGVPLEHPGAVVASARINGSRGLKIAREHVVTLPSAGRCADQLDEHAVCFGGIDGRPSLVADLRPALAQEMRDGLDAILHTAIDLRCFGTEHRALFSFALG
jgi:hypothetical protein